MKNGHFLAGEKQMDLLRVQPKMSTPIATTLSCFLEALQNNWEGFSLWDNLLS